MRPLTINGHRIKVNGRNVDRIHTYGGHSFAVNRCESHWLTAFNRGNEDLGVFNPYINKYVPIAPEMEYGTVIWSPRERKMWADHPYYGGRNQRHPEVFPLWMFRTKYIEPEDRCMMKNKEEVE